MNVDEALTSAIEGADAAVYAYGVIGSRLDGAGERRARRAMSAHRSARARWQGRTPQLIGSAPAFEFPQPVQDAASARALAVLVERRLAGVYADLAAALTGSERADAISDAMACETRAVGWGAQTQAFPHA